MDRQSSNQAPEEKPLARVNTIDIASCFTQCGTDKCFRLQSIDWRVTVHRLFREIYEIRDILCSILIPKKLAQYYLARQLNYSRLIIIPTGFAAVERALKFFYKFPLIQEHCPKELTDTGSWLGSTL